MNSDRAKNKILEARNIVKDFPGVRALDGVTFDVYEGEVHALVGENGAGKSTLIKILAGVHPYGSYDGNLLLNGAPVRFSSTADSENSRIAVIHQELMLIKHATVAENIFLGNEPLRFGMIDYERMFFEADALMKKLGIRIDVRAELVNLGVGVQQMVEIAKAVRKNSKILVLDEPTAALAEQEVATLMKLMRELRAAGNALVYISHKLNEVFDIADRITVLRDGKTVGSDIATNWTREKIVNAMVGREMTEMFPKVDSHPGEVVLEVDDISADDPEVPGRMLLQNVSFNVRKGEILGIAGLMGSGRTELLQAIFGASTGLWRGKIKISGKEVEIKKPADAIALGLALVPEDRKQQGLALFFSVLENLAMAHLREFCVAGVVDSSKLRRCAEQKKIELEIKTPSLESLVNTLSGGNQQKVVLGKWLMKMPKVLLLDEPTRGVDVGAKAEIHRLVGELTKTGTAVVMVSSELPELLAISDRIIVLSGGCKAGEFSRKEATPEKIMEVAT